MRRKSLWEKIIHFPVSAVRCVYVSHVDCVGVIALFVFRFIAAHLVARRLIYPGSLSLLNAALCKSEKQK